MKYRLCLSLLVGSALCLGPVPLFAQHGHGGGGGHGMGTGGGHDVAPMGNRGSMTTPGAMKTPDQLLAHNTKLSSKLQGLLPPGTNVQQAASGFKNLGQFVAAVHVSHNLGIPFSQLKARMVSSGESLGKAIHGLKPAVNARHEAKRANGEAKRDLEEAGS